MHSTIGVAMATYNGIKYIGQQLDSICRQTLRPELISISDDCSSDGTFEFLEEYKKRSEIPIVLNSNTERLGVIENFLIAFSQCDTDFIAYCDQDDVWHEYKLSVCADILARGDIALVFHRSAIVDSELEPLGRAAPANIRRGLYKFPHFPDNLWGFGHQMIFSRRVLEVMSDIKRASSPAVSMIGACFDFSLLVAAGSVGNIYFVDQDLTKFRRHEKSVSPAGKSVAAATAEEVDFRRNKIYDISSAIGGMASEISTNPSMRPADPDAAQRYLRHLRSLGNRYERRRAVYESKRYAQRLRALCALVLSNSYGSIRQNRLTARQLLLDGWRSLRGEALGGARRNMFTLRYRS
jgi:glycosyltransferase involved in cell wall biosynthesis